MRRVIDAAHARWAPQLDAGRRRPAAARTSPAAPLRGITHTPEVPERADQERGAAGRPAGRRHDHRARARRRRATTPNAASRPSGCRVDAVGRRRHQRAGGAPLTGGLAPARARRPVGHGLSRAWPPPACRARGSTSTTSASTRRAPRSSTCCAAPAPTSTTTETADVARRAGRPRARRHRQRVCDVVITPEEVPLLIDELPALAALATFGGSMRRARRRRAARQGERSHQRAGRPGCAPWAPTSTSSPTASPCGASRRLTGGIGRRPSRSPPRDELRGRRARRHAAHRHPRRRGGGGVVSRLLRRCSTGCGHEGRQGLPRRLHGRRQDHGGPRARQTPRLAVRGHRRADRAGRRAATSPRSSGSRARPTSAPSNARRWPTCCPTRGVVVATGGGTPVDPANRALMPATAPWPGSTAPFTTRRRPGAARRPAPAGRQPRRDGAAVQ